MTYIELCKYVFKTEGFTDFARAAKKKSRKDELKTARQICIYLGSVYFNGITLRKLAEPFGQRHANAIHSIKTISNRRDTEKPFNAWIETYIKDIDQLFTREIILMRVTKERELADLLIQKIEEMELIAKVYCLLKDKTIVDL